MAGSTNIKRFNESLANLESDGSYASDAVRTGGIPAGSPGSGTIASSSMHNKLFLQLSNFVAALAASMASKGYVVEDGSAGTTGHDFAALQAVLDNIMTAADTIPLATLAAQAALAEDSLLLNGKKWEEVAVGNVTI